MFESTILRTVEAYARMMFRQDDERVTDAIAIAWWMWSRRKRDYPASAFARQSVRWVLQGRDLPGLQPQATDCWRKLSRVAGGGMDGLPDRRPGPARIAEQRELTERFLAGLPDRDREMSDMLLDGAKVADIADALNLSSGRVSQRRRELMERLAGM